MNDARIAEETVPAELRGRPVVVLAGGRSGEREVSLRSGAAVHGALEPHVGDSGLASLELVEIGVDGQWMRAGSATEPTRCVAELPHDAVFFLALHGGDGEDGGVQGFLSSAGRAFTGSGVGASALAMDKAAARAAFSVAGLRTAPGRLVQAWSWSERRNGELVLIEQFADELHADALPASGWFVKPNRGGSSVHTFRLESAKDLPGAIEEVLATGDSALVEACIAGTEATCGVLGASGDARALPPVEIVPQGGAFFDYEQKYSTDGALEMCPPRNLDARTCEALAASALVAHRALGCDGYSRTDFIVPADGSHPVVLELNTLPGLTARSLQPQAAAACGLGFAGLCLEVLRLGALADRGRSR